MSEMVERCARAMAKRRYPGLIWPKASDPEYASITSEFMAEARAAIAAMREPDKAMELAGGSVSIETDTFRGPVSIVCDVNEVWRAMCDAALE